MTTVNWVVDTDGRFEVSSSEHLVQIMHNGEKYTNTGDAPANYLQAATSYIQTVDIDLTDYHGDIVPIGQTDDPFLGDYVGGGFSISGWSYELGTVGDGVDLPLGLFGEMRGSISQLKLRGVWSLGWSNCSQAGFLVGRARGSGSTIFDIDANFDDGTVLSPNTGITHANTCGILVGESEGISTGIRLSGAITYKGRSSILGGVVGEISDGASISWIRNDATFNKTYAGLGAYNAVNTAVNDIVVGGIVGSIGPNTESAFHLYNAMVGDIQGEFCGGIVGRCSAGAMTRSDTWVNCMQGNMTGFAGSTTSGCCGGIIGDFRATDVQLPVITKVANYMYGNISSSISGGIIGRTVDVSGGAAPAVQCSNSVIAMNGTVTDTAVGQADHSVALSVSVNADFGLVFASNSHASEDALTGYVINPVFPLPYLDMKGGELGVVNDFEIMFVNVGGVVETSPFFGREFVVIHNSPIVTFPYKTEFDFADTNTTVYLTYGRLNSPTLFIDPSITVLSTEALSVFDYSGNLLMGVYSPITVSVLDSESSARKQYHSFTAYTKEQAIANRTDTWSWNYPKTSNRIVLRTLESSALNGSYHIMTSRGMHYNLATNHVYYIDGSTGKFQAVGADRNTGIVDISTNGTYHTLQGDFSNTYMFGSKTSAGGSQQVFRTDADGTNEIVVDTSTLFEGNDYGTSGFAVDRDNQKVYFHDTSNYIVRSLSWDLTGLVNMQSMAGDLTLQDQNSGSLCYAQGFLYFGGNDPQTNEANSKFYQYDLRGGGTREMLGVSDHMRYSSQGPTNDLYIDPFQNVMVITGYSQTWTVEGTEFDFYKVHCSVKSRYYDGWDVTWEAVEDATSYQVVVNDIVVGTTTDVTLATRGHADGAYLRIQIKYSTDDVTYADALYRYTAATVTAKFDDLVSPSNYERLREGSATWLDPYNPSDIICRRSVGIDIYNFATETSTKYPDYGMHMFQYSFTTKDVIGLDNNRLINLGPGAEHVLQATVPTEFYTHPEGIQQIHCSFDGLIYFTVKSSNEVWSVKINGTDAQLLFTLNGTASSLATDPYNPSTLVYADGNDLVYRNLFTGASRVVLAGAKMSFNNGIVVLNDFIYTTYRWQNKGFLRLNIDGVTGLDQGPRGWGTSTLVDAVNQKVYQLDFLDYRVHVDGSHAIASLPPDPSLTKFNATLGPVSLGMSWPEVSGATKYRVGFSVGSPGANSITKRADILLADVRRYTIPNLAPETTYSLYLYYSTDTSDPSELFGSETFVTLGDSPSNYTAASFVDESGVVDLRKLDPATRGRVKEIMDDILTTGTKIQLAGRGRGVRALKKAKFVKTGEAIDVESDVPIAFSFTETAGAGQSATLNLSDDSTVIVSFDESTSTVAVGGVTYVDGDTLVLDGQKVTVLDA